MFLLLSSLVWLGCDDAQAPPDPQPSGMGLSFEADPIEDALVGSDGQVNRESHRRIVRLTEILGLDGAQVQALTAAYSAFRSEMDGLRTELRSGELGMAGARELASLLRGEFEAELQVIGVGLRLSVD